MSAPPRPDTLVARRWIIRRWLEKLEARGASRAGLAAVAVVAASTALRLALAAAAGLGDSEALYACYGLHPQGGYLDHPPLVGFMIRATTAIAGGSGLGVRLGSVVLFAGTCWFVWDLARRLAGRDEAGLLAVAILNCVPVTFLSGLAATPDAPSALMWAAAVWLLHRQVAGGLPDKSPIVQGLVMGALIGIGFLAKYTNVLLLVALVAWVVARRRRWLVLYIPTVLLSAGLFAIPVIRWNHSHEWISLAHRFIWSQAEAGLSLRNAGALVGGQLLYVSPVVMVAVVMAMVQMFRSRRRDDVMALSLATWIPAVLLWALCLWSRVAEPHWPVVAYLPAIAWLAARWVDPSSSGAFRTLMRVGTTTAAAFTAIAIALAATPWATQKGLVEPKTDITNELRGWDRVADKVRDVTPDDAIVTGPHWVICAQLEWALRDDPGRSVACITEETDDWDLWYPIRTRDPDVYGRLYYVSDERFEDLDRAILTLEARLLSIVEVERGGVVVRRFRIYKR